MPCRSCIDKAQLQDTEKVGDTLSMNMSHVRLPIQTSDQMTRSSWRSGAPVLHAKYCKAAIVVRRTYNKLPNPEVSRI